jgi:hypothetical protein
MRRHHFVLVLAVLPAMGLAQGGPPLLTDDPATPGEGRYEINTAITARYRQDSRGFEAPLVDMNFGMGARGQLKFELPVATEKRDGSSATTSVGSLLVGWKQRFHDQDEALPADISVYPQVSSGPLSRSKALGFTQREMRYLLPMEVAHTFDRFSVNAEVGYVLRAQSPHETLYGVAIGWKASTGTEWLAERHRILSADVLDQEDIVDLGLRRVIDPHRTLLMAVGASPYRTTDSAKVNIYIGVQFTN